MARSTVEAGGATYDTNQIPLPPDLEATTEPGTPVDIVVPLATIDPDADAGHDRLRRRPADRARRPFAGDTITYTPDAGCHDDSFAYVVTRRHRTGRRPGHGDDELRAGRGARRGDHGSRTRSVDVAVLANDTDPDGDTLTIDPAFPVTPSHGSSAWSRGRCATRRPPNYCGPDTFTYRISDGNGHQATAPVSVTVTCGQDGPTAADDNVSTPEDTPLVLRPELLANDGDLDGDTLTFTAVGPAAHGTTSTNGTVVRYTPAPDYFGPDAFTYTVSDGTATATATVNVSVTAPADSPRANPDSATVAEDGTALVERQGQRHRP